MLRSRASLRGRGPTALVACGVLVGLLVGCGPNTTSLPSPEPTGSGSAPVFTPPPTEPTGPTSATASGSGSGGGQVIIVGGPTLGTNYPGSWGNWGVVRQAADVGPVPVGGHGAAFVGLFFAPSHHAVSVLGVGVEPEHGPFRLVSTSCVGATISGPSPEPGVDPPAGVTGCRVTVGFEPHAPAPTRDESPDQGYYRGSVAFTVTRRCSSRLADPCSRIPASMRVDERHPVRVRWTRDVPLYGATACAPGQTDCPTTGGTPTPSPTPGPTSPSVSPSGGTS